MKNKNLAKICFCHDTLPTCNLVELFKNVYVFVKPKPTCTITYTLISSNYFTVNLQQKC